jgi:ribosomal-protein-alanine N-acetyltransferase
MIYENQSIRLVALTPAQLRVFDERPAELLAELGVVDTAFFNPPIIQRITRTLLLPRLANTPEHDYYFYTKWLAIDKATRRLVADLLIKQGPDAKGAIEIGYGVYPAVEGQGFMTRTVSCFLQWARSEKRIARVWAETRKDNLGSIKVLMKNGFKRVRETAKFYYWEVGLYRSMG